MFSQILYSISPLWFAVSSDFTSINSPWLYVFTMKSFAYFPDGGSFGGVLPSFVPQTLHLGLSSPFAVWSCKNSYMKQYTMHIPQSNVHDVYTLFIYGCRPTWLIGYCSHWNFEQLKDDCIIWRGLTFWVASLRDRYYIRLSPENDIGKTYLSRLRCRLCLINNLNESTKNFQYSNKSSQRPDRSGSLKPWRINLQQ